MVTDADVKLTTEERLACASALQELTVAALDLFDPRRPMDGFLDRLTARLGSVAALCVGEDEPEGASRLLGAAGLAPTSRMLPMAWRRDRDAAGAPLPYPELARNDLVRWEFRVTPSTPEDGGCTLLLFFEDGPRLPVPFRDVVERLAEVLCTALAHRRLYARTLESERQLHAQKTLLESQREASFDGILFVSVDGAVSCNRRFRELFSLPDEPPPPERLFACLNERIAGPEGFFRPSADPASASATQRAHVELKDGRVFDVTSGPVKNADGDTYGRGWHLRDATERTRAEAERVRLLAKEQAAREAAEDAGQRAAFLAEASRLLASSLDSAATLERIAQLALPTFADWCIVDIVEENGAINRVAVAHVDRSAASLAHKLRSRRPPTLDGSNLVTRVLLTGQSELHREITPHLLAALVPDAEHRTLLEGLGIHSLILVPMTARGRRIGAISLVSGFSGRRYGERDLALAEDLAFRAAQAVDNARLYLRAQEAVRARDEFLSIASHELRTPVTSLQLAAQGLLRLTKTGSLAKVPEEFLTSSLKTAVRQSNRMGHLIDRLLDVSRIQAGRMELQLEPVDLSAVCHEIVTQTAAEAAHAGCAIKLTAPTPVVGRWDRARLEQVVTNLLSNAFKYGAGRPVEIDVALEKDLARLLVKDSGIGIPPERQERIFERFERAVSPRHYSGLGLGLYIVRRVLEALGGSVEVESNLGRGSTFRVELPIAGPNAREEADREIA